MENLQSGFLNRLSRLRNQWRGGLCIVMLLRWLGWGITILTGYFVLDFFLAFETPTRYLLGALSLLVLAAGLIRQGVGIIRLSGRDMACRADRLLQNRRKTVLGAFELNEWIRRKKEEFTELQSYLIKNCVIDAGESLNQIRIRKALPFPEMWTQFKVLMIHVCLAAIVMGTQWTATPTILQRLFFPGRDIPPYSRFVFAVTPATPTVLYGGDIGMAVEITGAPVKSQVWFMTRRQGKVRRTACFQESPSRFAQRLEQVVSPIEFCFATGKARSHWRKVQLQLQPQIAVVRAEVTPPPYSRLPKQELFVGHAPLAVLAPSRVRLDITSNRPLLDGHLTIRTRTHPDAAQTVPGKTTGPQTVTFEWTATDEAELDFVIRDVQGTANGDPLKIRQKIIPDQPPEAMITQPQNFTLATPGTLLPLAGHVQDDLGLGRVDMIRTVTGYRDRIKPLGPAEPERRFTFEDSLDLKRLGVEVGQVLEFYLEAVDLNPSMLGIANSDIVRVQIISEDEYATLLRARSTAEEFRDRYEQVRETLEKLRKEMKELKDALESGKLSAEEKKQKLAEMAAAIQAAAEFFQEMAADFPIYDMEKYLATTLKDAAQKLQAQAAGLAQASPDDPDLPGQLARMMEELGGAGEAIDQQTRNAEEVLRVTRVMECASRFSMIVRRQTDLVRRLSRFEKEYAAQDTRLLQSLGIQQEEIREELVKLAADIKERAELLPLEYVELRESAKEFAALIHQYQIPETMQQSAEAAGNHNGPPAYRFAKLALEKLEELLSDCSGTGFGGLCQGNMKFQVPKDLKSTMEQMLAAMAMQMGIGSKPGAGGIGTGGIGMGGNVEDGYWMEGHSPVNIPLYGPGRTSLRPMQAGGFGARGQGREGRGTGGIRLDPLSSEQMDAGEDSEVKGESLPLEELPEKYREAIRKYFSH